MKRFVYPMTTCGLLAAIPLAMASAAAAAGMRRQGRRRSAAKAWSRG